MIPTKHKIFCIGRNKTGTTSLANALLSLRFRVGDQVAAELLIEDWAQRRFNRLVTYCKSADAFQDNPFGLDYTYQVMDYAFPGSRFILTVRESGDVWYESLTRFHTQIVNKGRLPTAQDLQAFPYRRVGWLWRAQQLTYGIDETTLYDREIYIRHYEAHNRRVLDYFKYRPDDLLVLDLADSHAMERLCQFLGVLWQGQAMPHLNRTR